jgi:hypothetical protein
MPSASRTIFVCDRSSNSSNMASSSIVFVGGRLDRIPPVFAQRWA